MMTPIDPVYVARLANTRVALLAIQYPPDAATSDMLTTTGLRCAASSTSRPMTSAALAAPPPLSMRRTIALTAGSLPASRIYRAIVEPAAMSAPKRLSSKSPGTIKPLT